MIRSRITVGKKHEDGRKKEDVHIRESKTHGIQVRGDHDDAVETLRVKGHCCQSKVFGLNFNRHRMQRSHSVFISRQEGEVHHATQLKGK
jgi:hypothetical protein